MRASLGALAFAAFAACDVSGAVVDRLPPPPMPPPDYRIGSTPCSEPPSCETAFVVESEVTALRPLHAAIAAPDEDAGTEDVLDPDVIDWRRDSIVLASAAPIDVVLDDAPQAGTLIELRGPVTLRFQNIASLEGLRIAGSSPESRLVFEHVTALELTLGDSDHRFAGRLEAKHTAFEHASVNAAHVRLDSAVFVDSFVAAATFVSRDGLFKKVVLDLGDGLFAPSVLRDSEIRRCDALSFFESDLQNVSIPRCRSDIPTRLYETRLVLCVIDGLLSVDTSKIEAVLVGQRDETSLLMWGTRATRIAFCDHARDVQLEPGSTVCSTCTEKALEGLVCGLSQDETDHPDSSTDRYNFCGRLDEAPYCRKPFPERARPHTDEE